MIKQETQKPTYEELTQKVQELESAALENKRLEEALKKYKEKIRENEERVQLALKSANLGLFDYNIQDNTLLVDDGWLDMLGYSPDEIRIDTETWWSWIHPDDRPKQAEAFQDHVDGRSPYYHLDEYRARGKSGDWVWLLDHGKVVEYDSAGRPLRLVGIHLNITERKQTEAEVKRLKNLFADIIDSMPSMLVGMDNSEIITQWNRQVAAATGIPTTEALGRPVQQLFPKLASYIEEMTGEIKRHRPATLEKIPVEEKGERRLYDLMLYPLLSNGVEGAVLRIEDVTERTRIQEMMIQTEKMMSMGGLAAGLAHEINNPLGTISQAAQNIERRVSPDIPANLAAAGELGIDIAGMKAYFEKREIFEFIGNIRDASSRASRIIQNILRFSRGAEDILKPTSPASVLDQALELAASDYDLKKNYDFKSIEIVRDNAPDIPDVPMIAVEIEQVMLNLLKNAAQAMASNPLDRKPRMNIRLRREDRYVRVEVEDNGPGMKEEVRRRVFEPFFTTKEPGIGTGLGLSVAYMIVTQNHKGLMEVDSTPGNGTCFKVRLPLG